MVASRDEYDVAGEVSWKRVEELFTRTAAIMEVWVNGERISTTAEHPFYHLEQGWVPASTLTVGDQLASLHGEPVIVTNIVETDRYEPVYNLRVQDHHTYFVGCDEWGFSVWAHNAECSVVQVDGQFRLINRGTGKTLRVGTRAEVEAFAARRGHTIPTERLAWEAQLEALQGGRNGRSLQLRYVEDELPLGRAARTPDEFAASNLKNWNNADNGSLFQDQVRDALGVPRGAGSGHNDIRGYRVDLPPGERYGVTDIKRVAELERTPQITAFHEHAVAEGLPFNFIVSTETRYISGTLIRDVRRSGGSIFEYNPATGKFSTLELPTAGVWRRPAQPTTALAIRGS